MCCSLLSCANVADGARLVIRLESQQQEPNIATVIEMGNPGLILSSEGAGWRNTVGEKTQEALKL